MAVNSLTIQVFVQRFGCYDSATSHTTISVERLVATKNSGMKTHIALACFGPVGYFHIPDTKNILERILF
jgi:hypothetical protein